MRSPAFGVGKFGSVVVPGAALGGAVPTYQFSGVLGTPICAAPGDELPTCSNVAGVADCSTLGMRSFIDLVTGAQFTNTLPGAQDACTCNAATGTLNLCNRPACTTASAAPTCPNGVAAQCSNYDSTITSLTNSTN